MKIATIVGISILFNFVQNEWIEVPQIDAKKPRIPEPPGSVSQLDEVLESPPITNSSRLYDGNFYLESKIDGDFFRNIQTNGFLPVLANMQRILVENVHNTVKSKIKFLKNMQNTILASIHEKIANLWDRGRAEARGYHEQEMDFPSHEGALMTIGFLTFAVFLIKLVLKLIHALKSKHVMAMPAANGDMPAILRHKREDFLDILKYIEEYKFTNN